MALGRLFAIFISLSWLFLRIIAADVRISAQRGSLLASSASRNGTIVVDASGTALAYTDSGVPPNASYITVFAVNGMGFNDGIFAKIQALAGASALRIVGVNRRGYGGSTPFTNSQVNVIDNGTEAQRDDLYRTAGVEMATFMDRFMQENSIAPISADGKSGGAALIGWSFGNILSLAAIAHIDAMPKDAQSRLAARIRAHVMQEPSSNALGLPAPPQNWVPLIDTSIPNNTQYPAFAQWVTAYFEHGNLSTRDPNVISYVLPAIFRPPSIFNMSQEQYNSIVDTGENPVIDFHQLALVPQLLASYQRANYNTTIRALLPKMQNWFITGDKSASFGPYALMVVENDNDAAGGKFIQFKVIPGVNHFIHWDNPETTLQVYREILDS